MAKHEITQAQVIDWINTEWERFASSFGKDSNKTFERSLTGLYRVRDHGEEKYTGADMNVAIREYNAAP